MSAPDPTRFGSSQPTVDWHVDDTPPEPYELPEIVLATEHDEAEEADAAPDALAPPTNGTGPAAPPTADVPAARVADPTVAPTVAAPTAARDTTAPTDDPIEHRTGVQGLGEYVGPVPTEAAAVALRRPGRRPRVRRVTRVLRHVDPWSAFKIGVIFSVVAYIVALTSGVLLWRVADSTGTLDNVERWFTQFGWETFEFDGEAIFRNARTIGLFGVVAMTGGIVLLVTLFNLVSDIVGGVRMTVLEEEVVERTASSSRRYVVRRTPAAAARASGTGEPAWTVDDGPDPLDLVAERPPVPTTSDWEIAASAEMPVVATEGDTPSDASDGGVTDDDLIDPAAELLAEDVAADWSIDDDLDDGVADAIDDSVDGDVHVEIDDEVDGDEAAADVARPTIGQTPLGEPLLGGGNGRTSDSNGHHDRVGAEVDDLVANRTRDEVDATAG